VTSPFDCEDTDSFLAMAVERRYKKGAVVMLQGEAPTSVHMIAEGWVKVTDTRRSGHETVLLLLGPGGFVGHFEAVHGPGTGSAASVVALEPTVTMAVATERYIEFLLTHPAACFAQLRQVVDLLLGIEGRRVDAALVGTGPRLAALLVDLADRHGHAAPDGIEIALALSQEELSGMIGASRDSVIRALTSLRSRGLLVTGRRSMTVRDLDALRAYAFSERTNG
jgi:CRP-like cAMP-binding protein